MLLTLVTVGSRGDVQPFIALANGLRDAGYVVRIATHAKFEDLILANGHQFSPIRSNPQELLNSPAGREWLDSDRNPIQLITNMIKLGKPLFTELVEDVEKALEGSNGVLYSLFGVVAYHFAEARNLPSAMVHLQPIMGAHTGFPAPGSPQAPSHLPLLGKLYNYWTYKVVEQVFWQPYRSQVNQLRTEMLKLDAESFWGPYRRFEREGYPMLHAYSQHVVPKPDAWPENIHLTGYWQADPAEDWQPSRELQAFLAEGEPPLYIGFGSMVDRNRDELRRMLLAGIERVGKRAVVLKGWSNLAQGLNSGARERIHVIEDVPHSWLFSKVTAVVHHGGAGTTAAGLSAGVPNFVIPYFADQHFWGERVFELGAGPKPVPRAELTAEAFAYGLSEAIFNPKLRRSASQLGMQLQNEAGVARAVALCQKIFSEELPSTP